MKPNVASRKRRVGRVVLLVAMFLAFTPAWGQFVSPTVVFSKAVLHPSQVAVVVNESFPGSLEVGEYYLYARGIPAKNLIRLNFPAASSTIGVDEFVAIRKDIDQRLDESIQVVVFVWTTPYAVACNSFTSAFSLGVQAELCRKSCEPTRPNPYFNSRSIKPYRDFGLRLSMLLPVESVEKAKALIDRGVASNGRRVRAKAFFLKTSDAARSSRARFFPKSTEILSPPVSIRTQDADYIESGSGIILYHIGAATVPKLDSLRFLPGAIADHLTSSGGNLLGSGQMSSLRWLEAGATGSYGTVSEPCNHWQKFPNSAILLKHYLSGATLIEAYWRSVAWPAQGLFIGEPLAAPYR
jgi:uncharacterized protein (TIGR03790 family)